MSCDCGCHNDTPHKTPAAGWKRFVPMIVAATVVVGVLIAGAGAQEA